MSDADGGATTLTVVPQGDQPEWVTRVCPTCGDELSGPLSGRGGINGVVGRHMWAKHKQRSAAAGSSSNRTGTRKGRSTSTARDYEATPISAGLRDVAAQVDSGTGPPSALALARAGGKALEIVSSMGAMFVVDSDPRIGAGPDADALRLAIVEDLKIDQRTGQSVMRPIGSALAPTALNRKYGRTAVENVDVLIGMGQLGAILMRWRKYMGDRHSYAVGLRQQQFANAQPEPVPGFAPPDPSTSNGTHAADPNTPPRGPSAATHVSAPPGTVIGSL